MPQVIKLAEITVVVDDDTGMYQIGEVDGGFVNNETLKHHIKKYGKEGIINQMAYMHWCVWNIYMQINNECSVNNSGVGTMQRKDMQPNRQP